MKIKLLIYLFLLFSTISYCQDFKKKHVPCGDKKDGIIYHYQWNDTTSIGKIDLLLFANKRFVYKYINFLGDTLISAGSWERTTDKLHLKNEIPYEDIHVKVSYLEEKEDINRPWNLRILKDLNGHDYRHAMVWISNHKMGCMAGMGACVTGEGFEKIDSIQIQIGKTIYSNWLKIERKDCDIQPILQTTDDLRKCVFLGDKEFIIKRRKLILDL